LPRPISAKIRPLFWLALLLVVALLAQGVVADHRTRTRGASVGFPAPVAEADVPILGINVALEQYDDEALEAALTRIADAGFVWVRQSFYWSQIEPQADRFDWSIPDRILTALARHPQVRLVAVLDDDPPIPPPDPDCFAAFAAAFASRYGAQVDYYQVWDEPNLADRWGGGPVSPPTYADLLTRTARAIRAADADARILLAGLAPTTETGPQNLSDVRYLDQLYQARAAPDFDIVAGKPYGFYTGPDDRRADETVLNFSRLLLLREVMVEHGDAGKAIWASHWGWNALPPNWTGASSLWGQTDEATQAAHTVAALDRARTEWPWVGAMMLEHFQPAVAPDDPRWGFALIGQNGAPRPSYDAVAAWSAALPSTALRAGSNAAPVGGYPALNPWATYRGDWRLGPLGADIGASGDRATFRFDGTAVALTVRRGPYRAFLYVTVDGEPANALPRDEGGHAYVVLHDSEPNLATVPLATGLTPGSHAVEVVAERGQGQWVLVDWRVGAGPIRDGFGWKITGLAAAGLVLIALLVRDTRRVDWVALGQAFLSWREWEQVILSAGLTGLLWLTAGASWGRDWGSPWLIVSLLALPVLVLLFALQLDLGLALVAFTAPYYMHPGNMLYRALSLPEVLVVLCGAGLVTRKILIPPPHLLPSPKLRRRKMATLTHLDFSVLLLLLAAVAASLAADDRWAALFELRAVFLLPALYYTLLRLARLDDQSRWRLADGLVLGGIGMALVGLVQYALGYNLVVAEGGLPRLQSVYFSPNNVGLYLGRVWPLLVAVALWGRRGRRRTFYVLALLPVALALALSFSRGALLLGIPAALLVMGWRAGGRWRWAAVALVVIGALALIPLLRMPRFASLLDLQQGSAFFRLEVWRSSLALLREHPWFGVGPGNFQAAYRTRYILPRAWSEPNLEHPHNVYLDHWTRLGLLGLLAGVAVQVAYWRATKPPSTPAALRQAQGSGESEGAFLLGLAGSMAALLAHGLVDNTLFFPDLALAFFLMLALVQWSKESRDQSFQFCQVSRKSVE
jgi:O-antigen ligase